MLKKNPFAAMMVIHAQALQALLEQNPRREFEENGITVGVNIGDVDMPRHYAHIGTSPHDALAIIQAVAELGHALADPIYALHALEPLPEINFPVGTIKGPRPHDHLLQAAVKAGFKPRRQQRK